MAERNIHAELAEIRAIAEAGFRNTNQQFAEVHRRFDASDRRQESIETQVRVTNGRVNKLEAWYDALRARIEVVAKNAHDQAERMWGAVG
jgi:predicted  nucleic acid-binding Zn-ribbon protein